jgi:hypothetical protein
MATSVQTEETANQVSLSWEDLKGAFPYGLPTSLRPPSWRRESNIVDLEQWRRRKMQVEQS